MFSIICYEHRLLRLKCKIDKRPGSMSLEELEKFIEKVNQLNQLVDSLDKYPNRKKLLIACSNHSEVVKLAQAWGYEIGRRWGDKG